MRLLPIRIGVLTLGILCFCLPFVRLSCNNQPFAEVTGVEYAAGRQIPALDFVKSVPSDSLDKMMAPLADKGKKEEKKDRKIERRWEAVAASILLIAALLTGLFLRRRTGIMISAAAAFLASLALGILYINLSKEPSTGNFMGIEVKYQILIGFWLAMALPLIAAVIGLIEFLRARPLPVVLPAEPVQPIAPTGFMPEQDSPTTDKGLEDDRKINE
jgi:hypothetical protein